jgi:very-short-patch-repair endonuclease
MNYFLALMESVHNLKYLLPFRRKLRKVGTPAEAELWKYLSNKKLGGRKFRRQHSVGNYIIDFYCHSEKLGIELDGEDHYWQNGIEKDKIKEEFLLGESIRIIRIENRWVFQDIDYVLRSIISAFEK